MFSVKTFSGKTFVFVCLSTLFMVPRNIFSDVWLGPKKESINSKLVQVMVIGIANHFSQINICPEPILYQPNLFAKSSYNGLLVVFFIVITTEKLNEIFTFNLFAVKKTRKKVGSLISELLNPFKKKNYNDMFTYFIIQ